MLFKEGRTKAVWSRARVIIHGEQGFANLLQGERADERACLSRIEGSRGNKRPEINLAGGWEGRSE
jgi:hypothetical protein